MPTILTLNLNYYIDKHGTWPQRLELIQEAIERASPQVVALQAVRRELSMGGGVDQANQIARLLPDFTEVFHHPADTRADGSTQGSAILSCFPLKKQDVLELDLIAGLDDDNPRVVQHAVVEIEGENVHVFNTHFSWVEAQARQNIEQTLQWIGEREEPTIVLGDMNTPPDSLLFEKFRQRGFTDAWAKLHPGDDGFTFEADKPFTRIDYAWVNSALAPRLENVEIIRNSREEEGVRLSDHYGLKVDLR